MPEKKLFDLTKARVEKTITIAAVEANKYKPLCPKSKTAMNANTVVKIERCTSLKWFILYPAQRIHPPHFLQEFDILCSALINNNFCFSTDLTYILSWSGCDL